MEYVITAVSFAAYTIVLLLATVGAAVLGRDMSRAVTVRSDADQQQKRDEPAGKKKIQ
jgi:hypothetical protein